MAALFTVMGDYPNPRVQERAVAAMINFIEKCPKNILTQYTDLLVSKLMEILSEKLTQVCHHDVCISVYSLVSIVTKEGYKIGNKKDACLGYNSSR